MDDPLNDKTNNYIMVALIGKYISGKLLAISNYHVG